MKTRVLKAQQGIITDEVIQVAKNEGISSKVLNELIAKGQVVILKNRLRKTIVPVAIGDSLKTKVCMPLIACDNNSSLENVADYLRIAQTAGVDCVFDMSLSSYIKEVRDLFLSNSQVPVAFNPFCELAYQSTLNEFALINITSNDMLNIVETYCAQGVDVISLNCSIIKSLVEQFKKQGRISKITSRSAQILFDWVEKTELENPYYKYFDDVLAILKKYDVTLHLSCAFKSGSIEDSFDSLQIAEYAVVADLIRRAHEQGVQVISDGIGHISIDKIPSLVGLIKEITFKAPMFITNALSCDCAIGYDNISSSIANSIAVLSGANLINVATSSDYLTLPSATQIKEGIVSAKIAINSGDVAKRKSESIKQNYKVSFARTNSNWKNMIKNSIDKSVFEGLEIKKQ